MRNVTGDTSISIELNTFFYIFVPVTAVATCIMFIIFGLKDVTSRRNVHLASRTNPITFSDEFMLKFTAAAQMSHSTKQQSDILHVSFAITQVKLTLAVLQTANLTCLQRHTSVT